MSEVLNVYEAKSKFSDVLNRVEAGEDIVIARAGRPVARLIPYVERIAPRVPGLLRGQIWIADDFDETPEDLIASFYGEN
jgi:prevent-host-death family protein